MQMLQLNPPIYLLTPKGKGWCHLVTNQSQEHHLQWTVMIDDRGKHHGEIWTFDNPMVRMTENETMSRPPTKLPTPKRSPRRTVQAPPRLGPPSRPRRKASK